MSWNYRVIQHDDHVALHEVYYNEAGEPSSWTENPVSFVGNDVEDLVGSLEMALKDARQRPALVRL